MTPSNIGWTDFVHNPGGGCSRVSPGCENCWAETLSPRLAGMGQKRHIGLTVLGADGKPRWSRESVDWPDQLAGPLKVKTGKRIFWGSMFDLFYEKRSFEFIAACFAVMAATPQHAHQLLTKRPARALAFFEWLSRKGLGDPGRMQKVCGDAAEELGVPIYKVDRKTGLSPWNRTDPGTWPLKNVHLGVTVEDQQRADERVPLLLQCPAAVRWLSVEPLLSRIDLNAIDATKAGWRAVNGPEPTAISAFGKWQDEPMRARLQNGVDWVVVGGETGEAPRVCWGEEIENVARQCVAAGVPVFVKQDAGRYPGRQGRISDATWALKQFPREVAA